MSTVLKIKGIRRWRVTYDDLNWVIQEKTSNKPPNNWINKYYFSDLGAMFKTLLKLGVSERKLTDFKGILRAQKRFGDRIVDALETLGEHFSLTPPESTRIEQVKKSIPKRKKKKGKK